MTNRRDLLTAAALIGPLSLTMRSALATDGEPQEPKATSKMADFLFVQNANRVTYADGKLTLEGVNPATVMFSDRPERIAGQMATALFGPVLGRGEGQLREGCAERNCTRRHRPALPGAHSPRC